MSLSNTLIHVASFRILAQPQGKEGIQNRLVVIFAIVEIGILK